MQRKHSLICGPGQYHYLSRMAHKVLGKGWFNNGLLRRTHYCIGGDSIIEGFDCRVSFNIIDFNKNKEYVMNDTLLHVIHY